MRPSRGISSSHARGFSVVLAVAVPLTPGGVSPELDAVAADLASASRALAEVERELDRALAPDGGRPAARLLADAEALLALGDHGHAALLLQDTATASIDGATPEGGRALCDLGQALYGLGNLVAARDAFAALVARRDREHLREAALRLIDIGDRRGRWDGVDEALSALRETGGALPPEVAYAQAKSLLRRGLAAQAEAVCAAVPSSHPLWAKARYLAAVAAVSRSKLERAAAAFLELTTLTGPYDDLAAVRELAAMDRGRLHLEQGRPADAALDYELVPRDSPRFAEALYEQAWARVRRAAEVKGDAERRLEYRRAADALELMLLADEGSALLPEARLLLGNILLHLGSYEAAGAAFEDVVRRYGKVQGELARLEGLARDPDRYFEVLARQGSGATLLPELALRWTARRDQAAVATRLLADLDASEASLAEATATADGLDVALAGGAAALPALRALERAHAALEATLAGASQRLLAAERELVRGRLQHDEAATLTALLAERAALVPDYQAATAAGDAAADEAGRRLAEVDRQAHGLRLPIQGMRDGLGALRAWLVDNAGRAGADDEKGVRERLHLAELEAQALGREQAELERALAREKAAVGRDAAPDAEVRRRLLGNIERERQLLARARGRARPDGAPVLADIDRLRAALDGEAARLGGLGARLAAAAGDRASEARRQLAGEGTALTALRRELAQRRREARGLIAEVATLALAEARARLEGVLLRADLGIVDVAWQLKERQGDVIDQRAGEERRDLSALDQAVKDVVGDD